MEPSSQTNPGNNRWSTETPAPGQRVMVTTANYRCLGYVDPKGVWRQSFSGDPLERVIGWEAIDTVRKN